MATPTIGIHVEVGESPRAMILPATDSVAFTFEDGTIAIHCKSVDHARDLLEAMHRALMAEVHAQDREAAYEDDGPNDLTDDVDDWAVGRAGCEEVKEDAS